MTLSIAVDHPDVVQMEAVVQRIVAIGKKTGIVLDQSPFVPQHADGGDRGHIITADGRQLYVAAAEGAETVHKIKDKAANKLAPGDHVTAVVDKDYRDALRRRHTACHVIYGAGQQMLGESFLAVSRTSLQTTFSEWKSVGSKVDPTFLKRLEARANAIINEDRAVSWVTMSRTAAFDVIDPIFADILPASAKRIRLVTIDGLPVDPCAGMHVTNLKQIGTITITTSEPIGEDVRIMIAVA